MEKTLIVGTGRSGTTFLMIIYTCLGCDTGFTKENFGQYILNNCNSGLEKTITAPHKIIKRPRYFYTIGQLLEQYKIKFIIVPERPLEECAKSRDKHKNLPGGYFNAHDYQSQLNFFQTEIPRFKQTLVDMRDRYQEVIYLDFYQMISDPEYLYQKLLPTFEREISLDEFTEAYEYASRHQRRKK